MAGPVNKRTYDATARQAKSAATRQRIIDSARALIVEGGYRATTIAAIIFMMTSIALTIMAGKGKSGSVLEKMAPAPAQSQPAQPAQTPAPPPQQK